MSAGHWWLVATDPDRLYHLDTSGKFSMFAGELVPTNVERT